jgi:DNA-binding NarL/FixJ family response regulator
MHTTENTSPVIRVVIADDHTIMRLGMTALLEQETGIEVVACVTNGEEACQTVMELKPDVVVMDMIMPKMGGLEATRAITNTGETSVLALSAGMERRQVVEVLEAGAMGYVVKGAGFEELVEGIRTVARNEVFLSSQVQKMILDDFLKSVPDEHAQGYDILTSRECEIVQLLAQGKCTKEIAFYYNISAKTVENHRQNIMKKLNFNSLADLTRYAIREGLISA